MPSNAPPNDDEEDDYMTMLIADAPRSTHETSFQRLRRERLAAAERGRVKSKAQLEADAAAARERVLSRSMLDDPAVARRSKGFAMMERMGFRRGDALGVKAGGGGGGEERGRLDGRGGDEQSEGDHEAGGNKSKDGRRADGNGDVAETEEDKRKEPHPRTEPITLTIKTDRGGIGLASERKRKFDEAAASDGLSNDPDKRPRPDTTDPLAYRDRVAREREAARRERQLAAAQRLAERLDGGGGDGCDSHEDEDENDDDAGSARDQNRKGKAATGRTKPLKSINVLWRGLVRARESSERDARIRRAAELRQISRQPRYVPADEEEDAYDQVALGVGGGSALDDAEIGDEELDEEDAELEEFEALGAGERLESVVAWLRGERRYCFWCGCGYEDEAMEGCPGPREEDHD